MGKTDYDITGYRKQKERKGISSSSAVSQNSKVIVEMNNSKTKLYIIILTIIAMFLPTIYSDTATDFEVCDTEICRNSSIILTSSMNETVDPCEDFYEFACGMFESNYSTNNSLTNNNWFKILEMEFNDMIRKFLTQTDEKHEPKAIHKARLFYKSCFNDTKDYKDIISEDIWDSMQSIGLNIDYLNDSIPLDLETIIAKVKVHFFLEFFFIISLDKQKSHVKITIQPDGSLKSKNYKMRSQGIKTKQNTNEKSKSFSEYFNVMKDKLPADHNINKFQKLLADDRIKQVLRDFNDKFEKLSQNGAHIDNDITEDIIIGKLQNLTDSAASAFKFNWTLCLREIYQGYTDLHEYELLVSEHSDQYPITIINRKYLEDVFILLAETPTIILKMAILNHVMSNWERKLKSVDDRDSVYCAILTKELFGLVTGYSMINTLNTTSKIQLNEMVDNIKWASREIIKELTWMDDETKNAAFRKLNRMKTQLGYPDNYTDILDNLYQDLYLTEVHVENKKLATTYHTKLINKITADDEHETAWWLNSISVINAFAVPSENAFYMPVAILQFPYYHNGLQVLDYASAGSIIGHELTHHFDTSGRQYDEFGKMIQWWSEKSTEEYTKRANCLVDDYNNITVIGYNKTVKINGTRTLGENISDIVGLREAYNAYQHYVDKHGEEPRLPGLERFTQEQLFFLKYANHYCQFDKNDTQLTSDDVHSPLVVRTRKVLSLLPEFNKAWSCPLGSGMNPNITKCTMN